MQCYYRYDQSFSGPSQLVQGSHEVQGHLAEFGDDQLDDVQYNFGSDSAYTFDQQDWSPAAMLATPESVVDSNWYPDSGATHHITSSEGNLAHSNEFTGSEKVLLGNGMGLQISNIGRSSFTTKSHNKPLILDKLLHVPKISKNLLSVSKFASDNNAFFEFYPHVCFVKDQVSRAILLQ